MRITDITITLMPRPMPLGLLDPMPRVIAIFKNATSKTLFTFYPDEITFSANEFIGLTEEEAHALFHRKDTRYLRS